MSGCSGIRLWGELKRQRAVELTGSQLWMQGSEQSGAECSRALNSHRRDAGAEGAIGIRELRVQRPLNSSDTQPANVLAGCQVRCGRHGVEGLADRRAAGSLRLRDSEARAETVAGEVLAFGTVGLGADSPRGRNICSPKLLEEAQGLGVGAKLRRLRATDSARGSSWIRERRNSRPMEMRSSGLTRLRSSGIKLKTSPMLRGLKSSAFRMIMLALLLGLGLRVCSADSGFSSAPAKPFERRPSGLGRKGAQGGRMKGMRISSVDTELDEYTLKGLQMTDSGFSQGDLSPTEETAEEEGWRDMRVHFNRAMAQLQSDAQQPSAKEAAKELSSWLMQILSQPEGDMNPHEKRALVTNLKRISQLQKENLQLKLKQVVSSTSGQRRQPFQKQKSEMVEDFTRDTTTSGGRVGGKFDPISSQAHIERTKPKFGGSESSVPSHISYCEHQQPGYSSCRPGAYSRVSCAAAGTPYVPKAQKGLRSQGHLSLAEGTDGEHSDMLQGDTDGFVMDSGVEGEADMELNHAMKQLEEMRQLNRRLGHQVSKLVNENLRLKSVLHQAESSILEAAVAQLSPVDVAQERAVPAIVKAAASLLDSRDQGTISLDDSDPLDRGLVVASAALLKRTGLRVGDRVKLKRELSRDRLGTTVTSNTGIFLGVLVGEAGEEDATVYLHMDDNQVRQFALSEIEEKQQSVAREEEGRRYTRVGAQAGASPEHQGAQPNAVAQNAN
mmetsp:Transcript_2815/g.4583  ORF Transcript_2815/g.4583 Transcript_2815/m.4583 type:complete len:726 (+) Transcript_2815:123-2300(+)